MMAIPAASRRDMLRQLAVPAGFAFAGGSALLRATPQASEAGTVVEAEDFGGPAPVSGDAAPALRAALADLAGRGGGTLRLRTGKTYRLESIDPATRQLPSALQASIGLPAGSANINIDLNGATLLQVAVAATIGPGYRRFNDPQLASSVSEIAGEPRRGDRSVRLRSGSAPAPGAVVMLVSGNTTPRRQTYLPVAEMLVVADASHGEVAFDRPLAKDHRRLAGMPTGLIDLSSDSVRNFAILGPGTVDNPHRHCGNLMQIMGLRIERVHCHARAGLLLRGRDIAMRDCTATVAADWSAPVIRPMCLALDTGTSNVTIERFRASGGSAMTYLHLHEGLADVSVTGLRIDNGSRHDPDGAIVAAVSIQGGSRNVTLSEVRIHANPQGPGLLARQFRPMGISNHGLTLRDVVLSGRFAGPALVVQDDASAVIENIDLRGARVPHGQKLLRIEGKHRMSGIIVS